MTFDQWLHQVDLVLEKAVGMSTSDLGDFPSRDHYDDGMTPHEAAESCLEWNDAGEDILALL